MATFNKVIVIGNVTRAPALRFTKNRVAVCDLGLAVNERRKDALGEWTDEPVFIDVTVWNRLAEIASNLLHKGSPVLLEGRLRYESWEQDGQKRSRLTVTGERMQMLGSKPVQEEEESTESEGEEA